MLGAEDPNALIRTWGSAADPLFHHDAVITATSDEPDSLEVDSEQVGAPDTVSYDLGAGPVTTQADVAAAVSGRVTFHDGTVHDGTFALFQDQTGKVFLLISDSDATLASKAVDSLQVTAVLKHDYGGLFLDTRDDLSFVCFAAGTRILTPEGMRPVETLAEGRRVITADHGAQPLTWVAARRVRLPPGRDRDRPVRFAPGALGPGVPARPLAVSPRHRMLVHRDGEARFCAAIFLVGAPGVTLMQDARAVEYHALMCARHAVIFAEGAGAESFHPGPHARRILPRDALVRLLARRPDLADPEARPGPLARPDMLRREGRALVDRARALGGLHAAGGAPFAPPLPEGQPLAIGL